MDQPVPSEPAPRETTPISFQEQEEERRKLRRLQIMMSMVMSVISQDADLSVEEAAELVANAKRAALAMFPDKELAYDILYKPRLQRLMAERFRLAVEATCRWRQGRRSASPRIAVPVSGRANAGHRRYTRW